jgi:hypothetical protein
MRVRSVALVGGREMHPNTRHGHARGKNRSPEYRIWLSAKNRVTNPNNKGWPHYGGRGITMCQEWLDSFEAFLRDVGPRPEGADESGKALYSIDRIDNDLGYFPANVKWSTQSEQNSNQRRAFVTREGKLLRKKEARRLARQELDDLVALVIADLDSDGTCSIAACPGYQHPGWDHDAEAHRDNR